MLSGLIIYNHENYMIIITYSIIIVRSSLLDGVGWDHSYGICYSSDESSLRYGQLAGQVRAVQTG